MSTLALGRRVAPIAGLLLVLEGVGHAQTITQQFNLHAGWNAVWMEVEPDNSDIGVVFTNLPLSSVWTYVPNANQVQFIKDPSEASFNDPVWLRYFPIGRAEAFANNLYAVHAAKAYLLNLTASAALTVTGQPLIKARDWQSDSYNLRGFPVDPDHLPTFGTFFSPSPAHAGQPIYHLGADGKWVLVDAGASMASGEAYWVYCKGASSYRAPLGLELELGDGLDFDVSLTELTPRLRNLGLSAKSISIRDVTAGNSSPLSYLKFANNTFQWVNLPDPLTVSLGGSSSSSAVTDLRLAIRRKDFPGGTTSYASILEIKDNASSRYLVPMTGAQLLAARASLASAPSPGARPALAAKLTGNAPAAKLAGLWVGTANINLVNQPSSTSDPALPQPTRSPFPLRLLLHVTDRGEPRLLKEVIQMWQESVRDANGQVTQPGRFVLLTDDSLIPKFSGSTIRSDQPVGRRISTADFDFPAGKSNYLAMAGGFGIGETANCTIVLSPEFPTNPFLHRYHPDHDNKDNHFDPLSAGLPPEQQEVYEITRNVSLTFSADPSGANDLSSIQYGDSILGGTYHESIKGLHKAALEVEGTFRLTRVNNSPVLNQ
jgi:hypothetical protein